MHKLIALSCMLLSAFCQADAALDYGGDIETTDWSVANIDEHVADVRNAFLRTLGQPELSVEETARARRDTPDDLKPEVRGRRKKTGLKNSASDPSEQDSVPPKRRGKRGIPNEMRSVGSQNGFDPEAPATRH